MEAADTQRSVESEPNAEAGTGSSEARLDAAVRRIADLADRWAKVPDTSRPADVGSDARALLEELQTAHAQLHHQSVELSSARAALEAERLRFHDLFELAREGHLVTDAAGVVREGNHGAATILNLPEEVLVGKPLVTFVRDEDRRDFRVRTYRAGVMGATEEWTGTLVPRGLSPIRVSISVSPAFDDRGTTRMVRWLIRDVSGSRSALVANREPASIVRAALDALSAHVAVLDHDGRIVSVNRAWHDAGLPAGLFSPGAGSGASYLDLCEDAFVAGRSGAAAVREAVVSVLKGTAPKASVAYAVNASVDDVATTPSWFFLRVTRCDGPDPVNVVATHEDITAERQAFARERALLQERAARAAAEAASRTKSEFLATLSHELRTPLNAIAGYAQLLEMGVRGPVTPGQAEDLRRILRSERHLLGLINELLNFSRIEHGGVQVDVSPVVLPRAVVGILELVEPQARARSLAVDMQCLDEELVAVADLEKLRQILLNVLSNALKFTPPGGTIRIECLGEPDRVVVRVHDTGIGIPNERLEDIFDPFVQVNRPLGAPADGIGLGLAISRTLARAMHGDLRARNAPGQGSTFELTLPRADNVPVVT